MAGQPLTLRLSPFNIGNAPVYCRGRHVLRYSSKVCGPRSRGVTADSELALDHSAMAGEGQTWAGSAFGSLSPDLNSSLSDCQPYAAGQTEYKPFVRKRARTTRLNDRGESPPALPTAVRRNNQRARGARGADAAWARSTPQPALAFSCQRVPDESRADQGIEARHPPDTPFGTAAVCGVITGGPALPALFRCIAADADLENRGIPCRVWAGWEPVDTRAHRASAAGSS